MVRLDKSYWEERYTSGNIGWDLGSISPPLKAYVDQLEDKNLKILIPGAGNAYEAEYLFKKGFKQVYVADVSKTALNNLKKRVPEFPERQLLHKDFFNLDLKFDLIIEQTFFCALDPKLRSKYVEKMQAILKKNGQLVGLFFNVPLNDDQPPFGGSKSEYIERFTPHFQIKVMDMAYNSHPSRSGRELFVNLQKK
ncbi:methyltransferase domain-containing protein [Psychroserpens sp. BH13MA-6]